MTVLNGIGGITGVAPGAEGVNPTGNNIPQRPPSYPRPAAGQSSSNNVMGQQFAAPGSRGVTSYGLFSRAQRPPAPRPPQGPPRFAPGQGGITTAPGVPTQPPLMGNIPQYGQPPRTMAPSPYMPPTPQTNLPPPPSVTGPPTQPNPPQPVGPQMLAPPSEKPPAPPPEPKLGAPKPAPAPTAPKVGTGLEPSDIYAQQAAARQQAIADGQARRTARMAQPPAPLQMPTLPGGIPATQQPGGTGGLPPPPPPPTGGPPAMQFSAQQAPAPFPPQQQQQQSGAQMSASTSGQGTQNGNGEDYFEGAGNVWDELNPWNGHGGVDVGGAMGEIGGYWGGAAGQGIADAGQAFVDSGVAGGVGSALGSMFSDFRGAWDANSGRENKGFGDFMNQPGFERSSLMGDVGQNWTSAMDPAAWEQQARNREAEAYDTRLSGLNEGERRLQDRASRSGLASNAGMLNKMYGDFQSGNVQDRRNIYNDALGNQMQAMNGAGQFAAQSQNMDQSRWGQLLGSRMQGAQNDFGAFREDNPSGAAVLQDLLGAGGQAVGAGMQGLGGLGGILSLLMGV